jgi:hypothetical protein
MISNRLSSTLKVAIFYPPALLYQIHLGGVISLKGKSMHARYSMAASRMRWATSLEIGVNMKDNSLFSPSIMPLLRLGTIPQPSTLLSPAYLSFHAWVPMLESDSDGLKWGLDILLEEARNQDCSLCRALKCCQSLTSMLRLECPWTSCKGALAKSSQQPAVPYECTTARLQDTILISWIWNSCSRPWKMKQIQWAITFHVLHRLLESRRRS